MNNESWTQLRDMSELIADAVIKKLNPRDDTLSRNQAERMYGAHWLRIQEAAGRIRGVRMGTGTNSKVSFSRHELDCLWYAEREKARIILETK